MDQLPIRQTMMPPRTLQSLAPTPLLRSTMPSPLVRQTMVYAFEGTGPNWIARFDSRNDHRSFMGQIYWGGACFEPAQKLLRRYIPGPNGPGTKTDNALQEAIDDFEGRYPRINIPISSNACQPPMQPAPKIFVFGYSRGGYLAMCFGKYLRNRGFDVAFMGLFDAVALNPSFHDWHTDNITDNVLSWCHGIRSEEVGSRKGFGSVGPRPGNTCDARGEARYFHCTHAAMGGFLLDTPETDPKSDRSRSNLVLINPLRECASAMAFAQFMSAAAMRAGALNVPIRAIMPSRDLINRANHNIQIRTVV